MKLFGLLILIASVTNLAAQHEYLGNTPPVNGLTPLIFGEGKISTGYNERDMTISPDGTEIYFTLQYSFTSSVIVYIKYENGKWGRVKRAPFSSIETIDIEPAFSPNGQRMFFASKRGGDFDIYYVDRQSDGAWSPAVNVGSPVNSGGNEFYPSVTENGTLYFTAAFNGNEDIWTSALVDGKYQTPVALPSPISTQGGEFNAYISSGGDFIYYSSERTGGGDIYSSSKSGSQWSEPTKMIFNTSKLDYCPFLSPDKEYLFFTSERSVPLVDAPNPFEIDKVITFVVAPKTGSGNIYWVRQ